MRPSPGADPASPAVARPGLTVPTLFLPADVPLPLRQDVPLPDVPWPRVADTIRSTLAAGGFQILSASETPPAAGETSFGGFPRKSETVAERRRQRAPMPAPTRVSVYVLFGAGLGLGIFDAVAVGVPIVALAWAGGSALVAALFWLRYGRSFQSEVVVVALRWGRPTKATPGSVDHPTPHVAWFAGRIRSDVRGGHRTAVEVTVPQGLARDAGALARDFQTRLAAVTPN